MERVTELINKIIEKNRHSLSERFSGRAEHDRLEYQDIMILLEKITGSYWAYYDQDRTYIQIYPEDAIEEIRQLAGEETFRKIMESETPADQLFDEFFDDQYDFTGSTMSALYTLFESADLS